MTTRSARRTMAMVAVAAGLLVRPALAVTPGPTCQASKNKEAGKYDYCRLKAESNLAKTGDAAKYAVALQRCSDKFTGKWPLLEAKAAAQGGACPSVGDQAAIQAFTDQHTDGVAAALAGGTVPECAVDLAACQANLATCLGGGVQGQLLRTGQTTCYDASGSVISCGGTGQDGELQNGLARSFTDNGDGTITDDQTGLMWEKLSDDASIHDMDSFYSWTTAVTTKIAALNSGSFAGYTDWRLPNVNELQSLTNYGSAAKTVFSAFNTGCATSCTVLTCSCTQSGFYWSSSTYQETPGAAWIVDFLRGRVLPGVKTLNIHVRAVRGGS